MTSILIKHKSSGKYVHPFEGSANPDNGTHLVLYGAIHDRMHWTFEPIDGPWGYIKHVKGGKIWHPITGSIHPKNDEKLVLHGDRHAGALFALDEVNDCIVHKGGATVHPLGGSPNPPNDNRIVLYKGEHDAMRFVFVDPSNPNQDVSVYGKPCVTGSWKIISSVLNPLADHKYTMEYTLGKSKTESTSSSFTFKWETSFGAKALFSEASTTASFTSMVQNSSSSTWSEERKVKREITVKKGDSVVTWQFVFAGEQLGNKSTFFSNILADTRSPDIEPDESAAFSH